MDRRRINVADLRGAGLRAGDLALLSGRIYTARDAAHRRMIAQLDNNESLPFELSGAVIYYAGPTPPQKGMAVGSCGPTTSGRMDSFAPRLISLSLAAMIGKGERSPEVVEAMIKHRCLYFAAVGGAGALIAKSVKSAKEIAYPELGCESVKELIVEDMPVICAIDSQGGNLYKRLCDIF